MNINLDMNLFQLIRKNRTLDSTLCIVANVFFLFSRFVFKKNKFNQHNVLIISLHKIGDSIFTLPAIKNLIQHYSPNKVTLLVYEEINLIFREQLNVKEIITVNKSNFHFSERIADINSRKIIKETDPEIIIDLTGSILSASLIFNSSAKKIIGMNEKYFRKIYSDFVEIRKTPHLINRYNDVASLVIKKEIKQDEYDYKIIFNKVDKILIHPFAGWKEKEWGIKKYISLTEMLSKNYDAALIFQVNSVSDEILSYLTNKKVKFIETKSVENLKEEILKASLFIGNDSGPVYLASLCGKPTFTIYGPTNPLYSKPFGKYHKQVYKNLRCSPTTEQYCYLSAGRECPSNECMVLLDEDYIFQEVIKFIKELNIQPTNN